MNTAFNQYSQQGHLLCLPNMHTQVLSEIKSRARDETSNCKQIY
jgi:hypothetical protein